jgi:UPF0755 protein
MRGDIVPPKREEAARAPEVSLKRSEAPSIEPEAAQSTDTTPKPDISVEAFPPASDERPLKKSKKRLFVGIIGGLFGAILVLMLAGFLWYSSQLTAVTPGSDEKVKITVEPGSGVSAIASTLKENDLIKNELAFDWYLRLSGKSGLLQSGSYRIGKGEDVPTIVGHLTSGNTDTFSITFLPGNTLAKHRQTLIDAGYDASIVDAALEKKYDHAVFAGAPADADLEGFIYGETYNFGADATPEQILTRTFDQLELAITENDLVKRYEQQGFSLYQGITMASIIQREVVTAEDAAQVAQVFKKRYDMGMQLGSDVTYQYIADKTGQARSVDLDSPYNTRRYPGLPPGPISSPGLAALKAVGSPTAGDYLYFLSGDDDKTYFARTNEEHEKNIELHCQKKCQII